MSVALSTMVPSLERSLSTPGENFFPDALQSDWVGVLADAFSDGRLNGLFGAWALSTDYLSIEPVTSGGVDIDVNSQRVVVLYAALNVLTTQLANLATASKYQAGPALMETQRSAQLLQAVLASRQKELQHIVNLTADMSIGCMSVTDGLIVNDALMNWGLEPWVN